MSDTNGETPEPARDIAPTYRMLFGITTLVVSQAGLLLLVFVDMPDSKMMLVSGYVGLMFGWAGATITYYLGGSQGSSAKDAVIRDLAKEKQSAYGGRATEG